MPPLSAYPLVIVRVACRECPRAGSYRLARLAVRFGSETDVREVLMKLSADCPNRSIKRHKGEHPHCGAYFPDLDGRPEPEPPVTHVPPPLLRVVSGRH